MHLGLYPIIRRQRRGQPAAAGDVCPHCGRVIGAAEPLPVLPPPLVEKPETLKAESLKPELLTIQPPATNSEPPASSVEKPHEDDTNY